MQMKLMSKIDDVDGYDDDDDSDVAICSFVVLLFNTEMILRVAVVLIIVASFLKLYQTHFAYTLLHANVVDLWLIPDAKAYASCRMECGVRRQFET